MDCVKASVVLPVFNQFKSLEIVLRGFAQQSYDKGKFEILIIDDGSSDELAFALSKELKEKYGINIKIFHYENAGRASARNRGIKHSIGEIIIFCDGDRIPCKDFVKRHIESHQKGNQIVIGRAYDYFGKENNVTKDHVDWEELEYFSKLPLYSKRLEMIYDIKGNTEAQYAWLSFLVGNSSIDAEVIKKHMFSEVFVDWGFEHFELGYRLTEAGYTIHYESEIGNYHIPHARHENFYNENIEKNIFQICSLHPLIDKEFLYSFFFSKNEKYNYDTTKYYGRAKI